MKKVFMLLTIVAMGIPMIGCGEEKKKEPEKPKAPASTPADDKPKS